MEWENWFYVTFVERSKLPSSSGVYVVVDANNHAWYVGIAVNLKARWLGKSHHRYPQLIRSNKKYAYKIYWKEYPTNTLVEQEKYYIDLFKPELNGCKVKKYLPKIPQVEREIKRLLKVLNQPNFFFPVIRSLVAGEYKGDNGERCIIIIVNSHDTRLLRKSIYKKYSPQVRNSWIDYTSYCGKNEDEYQPIPLFVYKFGNCKFEFLYRTPLILYFEENLNDYEKYVCTTELLGVQVKALRDKDILWSASIQEEYKYIDYSGKKYISCVEYLNYRSHQLRCLCPYNFDEHC